MPQEIRFPASALRSRCHLALSAAVRRDINKTDLAPLGGADLDVMASDSRRMRGSGPFIFAQVTNGIGVQEIASALVANCQAALRDHAKREQRPLAT